MDCRGRKCRQANRDVLGTAVEWRAVLDPLAAANQDSLAGGDIERSVARRDSQHPLQDHRVWIGPYVLRHSTVNVAN